MTAARIRCLVPFCARTRGLQLKHDPTPWPADSEWLCGNHFRLVDRRLRRLRRRVKARADALKAGAEYRRGEVHLRLLRADDTDGLIWKRMKSQALKRALP